jgi:hypothetical protein
MVLVSVIRFDFIPALNAQRLVNAFLLVVESKRLKLARIQISGMLAFPTNDFSSPKNFDDYFSRSSFIVSSIIVGILISFLLNFLRLLEENV